MLLNDSPAEQSSQVSSPIRLRRDEPKVASGKIAAFQYLSVIIFLYVLSGFWVLQVRESESYTERADANRIKSRPVLAPRGKILDRNGRVIVDNRESFSLVLARESLKEEHLKPISEGLNLDYEELLAKVKRFQRSRRPSWEPIRLKEELTPQELAFVEAHRDAGTFPELDLIPSHKRLYPGNGFAAHMVGYVGEVSEAELNSVEMAQFEQGDVVGKAGIEKQYNGILMGVDGQRQSVVDSMGNFRRTIGEKPAVAGKNLQLTIDLDLQAVAELAMENKRGAVVAMDPRNGEVLAMVSRPAYDPNKFAGRIKSADWKEIINNPDNPLLNRAIQGQLAPGSTFKPFMALAGLDSGVLTDDTRAHCSGGAVYYGRYFKCHQKGGHGTVDLRAAIAKSCDVFFYNLGNKMGIDTIAKYATLAGFGKKTGIDLPQEKEGTVPSSEWKIRNFRQKWYAGETISVSIGQGALTSSPIQLATAASGLVTGGVWPTPHLVVDSPTPRRARKVSLNPEHINKIIYGLFSVVNVDGTAGRARIPGIDLSGKTGTAQLASNTLLKGTKYGRVLKDTAWFFGFAPRQSPEIMVVAMYEAGEHGPAAAVIVRDVVKAYFDKKQRLGQDRLAKAVRPAEITVFTAKADQP